MRWRPMETNLLNYLNIGEQLVMHNELFINRYNVWEKLFPVYPFGVEEFGRNQNNNKIDQDQNPIITRERHENQSPNHLQTHQFASPK